MRLSKSGNLVKGGNFAVLLEQSTVKYSQINLKFKGLMRAVGNLYSRTYIVLPFDGERMNSALSSPYLKMLCCSDDLTAVRKLFVASDWSRIKTLYLLILPELHLVA